MIPVTPQMRMLEFRMNQNELLLDYKKQTEKCLWSIFDLSGIEKCTGMLNGSAQHRISVECLSPATYQLCVIDGDELHNTRFRVG